MAEDSKKSLQTRSDFEYQNVSYLDLDPPLSSELSSSLILSRSVIFLQEREQKAKAAAAEREALTQIMPNHVQVDFLLAEAYSGGGHRVTCLRGLLISRDTPKAIIRFIRHFFQEYLNI